MADVFDFYLQGSFKGVPFLFRQTSKTQGRKTVTYEYVNSDKRDVPDLGQLKPTYSISAYVTGLTSDYFSNRSRLEQALSSFGSGTFVHPTDGEIIAQVGTYTVEESISDVGAAIYNINFIATTNATFPTLGDSAASGVQNDFNATLDAINAALQATYFVTAAYQNALLKYRGFYQSVINQFNDVIYQVPNNSSTVSNFSNSVEKAQDTLDVLVLTGSGIINSTASMYNTMLALNTSKAQRSILNQSFFNFEITGQDYNDTPARVEAQINRRIMQQHINSYALIHEFLNTSQTTFDTESDIRTQSQALSDQYDFILNNNFYVSEAGTRQPLFDESVIDRLVSLRNKTTRYLTQQLANAKSVQTVYVHNFSLIEIVTSLYGSVDQYDAIANLNESANQAIINGDIKVLTQ